MNMQRSHLSNLMSALALATLIWLVALLGLNASRPAYALPVAALEQTSDVSAKAPLVDDVCFATINGTNVYSSTTAQAVRDALAAASPGDTVKAAGYCAGAAPDGGTTQVARITTRLTLAGGYTTTDWMTAYPVTQPTTLDALGGGRVISASVDVTLQGFTVTNGYAATGNGGGIYAAGAMTLTDLVVYSNTAIARYGGGAYISGAATVSGGAFERNTAPHATNGWGGGLYANATLNLTGTQFLSNTAGAYGGGLRVFGSAALTNAAFISNTATTYYGGGAYLFGEATVNGGAFERNTAPHATNGQGGGLLALTPLNLTGTQFLSNTAGANGGGLFAFGSAALTNAAFISNTATTGYGGGAAIGSAATVSGGAFERNAAPNTTNGQGGGLYALTTLNLTGTQFLSNTAGYVGGGLFAGNATALTNAAFISNTATTSSGGGAYLLLGAATVSGGAFERNTAPNTTNGSGGGLYAGGTLNLTGTQFLSNTAGANGGGVHAGSTTALTNAAFISNTAATSFGGGAYFSGAVTVSSSAFERNAAPNTTNGWGGGLYADSTLNLTGTQFLSNTTGANGGGVYANNAATLNSADLQGNACAAAGCTSGGLYANSHLTLTQIVTTVDDMEVRGNWLHNGGFTQNGGAVIFRGATTQIIAGSAPVIFASLAISNTGAGVYLGQNITVTNRLTLTTDLTTTGNYTLNLTAGATSAGSGDVWGNTARQHTFTADIAYSFGNPNVSLTFGPTSTLPSDISVALAHGAPSDYLYAVSRTYTLTVNGGGPYSATVCLHYQDSEASNGETGLKLMRYNGSAWENRDRDNADATDNWVEKSGLGSFSPWALANLTPTAITLHDLSAAANGQPISLVPLAALLALLGLGAAWFSRRRLKVR